MAYKVLYVPEYQDPGVIHGGIGEELKEVGRGAGRTLARGAEAILGLPGDVSSGFLGLANAGIGAVTGSEGPLPSKIPFVPGSQDIRKVTKKLTGESLEPKTYGEELYDDVIGDFASFLIPAKGKVPFAGAAIKALGGNTASWLTSKVGGGETSQAVSKLGFNVLSSFAGGRKALTKEMKQGYKEAESLSKDVIQPAKGLSHELVKEYDKLGSGLKTPWKKSVRDHIKTIEKDISPRDKTIPLKKVWDYKKELNKIIRDPGTDKEALPSLKKTVGDLNKVLADYAKKNPEFGKNFNKAEDVYRGLNQTSRVTNFLKKHVNSEKILNNPVSKAIFFGGLAYPEYGIKTAAAGLSTGYSARELFKTIDLFKNSKNARTYYKNAIQASLAGSVSSAERNMKKFDEEADKYYPTNESIPQGSYKVLS